MAGLRKPLDGHRVRRKRMRVLVTGGSGMVGRNFIEHRGAVAFDILAPSSRELDLRDYAAVSAYLTRHKPEVIIHAAGRVGGIQANDILSLLANSKNEAGSYFLTTTCFAPTPVIA